MCLCCLCAQFLLEVLHGPEGSEDGSTWYNPELVAVLFAIYFILGQIILINLLISIMNDTFSRIKVGWGARTDTGERHGQARGGAGGARA